MQPLDAAVPLPRPVSAPQRPGWWARQSTGVRIALIGGGVLAAVAVLITPIGWVLLIVAAPVGLVGLMVRPWGRPLAWVLCVPMLTIPMTLFLLGGVPKELVTATAKRQQYYRQYYWTTAYNEYEIALPWLVIALLPGLLNFVPFLWLRSTDARVRLGAMVAGILGAVRFLVPVGMLIASRPLLLVVERRGEFDFGPSPRWAGPTSLVSLALWALSAVVVLIVSIAVVATNARRRQRGRALVLHDR